ncbi:threonine efflux protein [Acinetobacter calcoaceticus]|uniref:Threonine efflux protein n=1 Tax=Acinetobacter calcoaceticus TaxID=471 RepID=A0A4R1XRM2_ACICA|nr:threonine efflux protein [Acinetobacter calcoaceticus]
MSLLLSICTLHFIAQLTPGPDVLLIAKSAASTTLSNTLKIILGVSLGVVVWVVLTLMGFTLLIQQWPWIQHLIMLLGGVFLAKMGLAMFRGGLSSLKRDDLFDDISVPQSQHYFLNGLLTNLSNPKIVIYFSSVFSLALASSADANLKLQLALIIPIQTFLTFGLLMWILSRPKIKTLYQGMSAYIDIVSGLLFMLFAVWLWLDAWPLFNLLLNA